MWLEQDTWYFLSEVEIKGCGVMIDERNFFDQPVENEPRTYDNIWKITTSQGNDYKAGCLLDYPCFKDHYKMIAIDLTKWQALDADPKTIQQINFTGNLDQPGNTIMLFIIEKAKQVILYFSQETVRVL